MKKIPFEKFSNNLKIPITFITEIPKKCFKNKNSL